MTMERLRLEAFDQLQSILRQEMYVQLTLQSRHLAAPLQTSFYLRVALAVPYQDPSEIS